MKVLLLLIPAVALAGGMGGFLIGYMPNTPSPIDEALSAKDVILYGGYGAGGSDGFCIGGMGFGGSSNFVEDEVKYVYEVGAGGTLLEYGKWLGAFRVSAGVVIGGMGERLMRWKDGGNSVEDFQNGTSQGYVFIERGSLMAMPMLGLNVDIGFAKLAVYGAYLLAYSLSGWQFDDGKPIGDGGDRFLNQWMVFWGIYF